MKEIKGIIVPILTPMHEDETVNYEELVNQIERLIAAGVHGIFVFGTNGEGYMVKNLHGQKNVYYQVNATYYSALGESDAKMLLARAIQLFMPGKPQVWYLDLFAGKNDCDAVARAGEGGHKEINRTNLTKVQIAEALEKPVVKKQLELLRLRRNCPAFAQGAKVQIESCGPELTIEWSCSGHVARLQANLQKLTYRVEIE